MRRTSGNVVFFTLLPLFAVACVEAHDADMAASSTGASTAEKSAASVAQSLACKKDPVNQFDGLHQSLECAGLYADMSKKVLADGVEPYLPGLVLWSDGALKSRWVSLPKGKKIDASNPADWMFPDGTRFFKEFAVGKHRVETRLWEKKGDFWSRATYVWNEAQSSATRSDGGDIMVEGEPYHVPTEKECDQCHQGRVDRALGFEQIGLGVAGSTGLTLQMLIKKKLITPVPDDSAPEISTELGDLTADIVGWTHMNCGVSCHNGNPSASSHQTGLRMRLEPDQLDGRPPSEYDFLKTTINLAATTPRWNSQIRVVPGSPENSLLYKLISSRGGGDNDQMPPIASRLVDSEYVDKIATWIRSLPVTK